MRASGLFAAMVVPLTIAASLALAVLSARSIRGIGVFRTLFSTSVAISVASSSVIWSLIFSPNARLFQWLLDALGLKATSLLTDAHTALPSVAFMSVWAGLGFSYLVALAGIQSIPRELYESASIDGVTGGAAFRYVTVPLMGPTLLFLFVISTIASLQAFTQFKVMIDSVGPDSATNVFVYAIFEAFWMENNYGFASAMSVVLFVLVVALAWLQLRLDNRVHYQ
jgi:ABC-type sugar transport system permease subunit